MVRAILVMLKDALGSGDLVFLATGRGDLVKDLDNALKMV